MRREDCVCESGAKKNKRTLKMLSQHAMKDYLGSGSLNKTALDDNNGLHYLNHSDVCCNLQPESKGEKSCLTLSICKEKKSPILLRFFIRSL